ncbi:MAG: hypothetical protein IPG96_11000 [Proteobacteria bacterium]|nr:hypothetical protein [Pseudomonadota bacterium]
MRGITSSRWIVSAALAIAITTTGPQAQAATGKPGMRQAKRAFKAGQTFMRLQRYADAVVEFKKAHAHQGRPGHGAGRVGLREGRRLRAGPTGDPALP